MNPRPAISLFGVLAASVLTGCMTGERPTLAESKATGYAAVDAVLERVEGIGAATYTADYEVVTVFSGAATDVTASQASPAKRSLTIGDVRYVVNGSATSTCTVSTGECTSSIDAARVSDVQLTPDFFGTSMAARIRRDAAAAVAEPGASTEEFDGKEAACAAIPVDGATVTYCVLDNGVLTRLDGSDVKVTITRYEDGADAALFTP